MSQPSGSNRSLVRLLPIAVALALVAVLTLTAPDLSSPPRQWIRLDVGETGTLRDLTLTVTRVQTSSAIDLRDSPLRSTETFVVVQVEATALVDPVVFNRIRLQVHGGDRYLPRGEWPTAKPPLTQAGFTSSGTWVFEVPTHRVAEAELLVENDSAEFDAYDRGLRVVLGLTTGSSPSSPLRLADATIRVDR